MSLHTNPSSTDNQSSVPLKPTEQWSCTPAHTSQSVGANNGDRPSKPTPIATTENAPAHELESIRLNEQEYNPYEVDDDVYEELSQVPKTIDFQYVTKKQVGEFLRLLKLHQYIEVFDEEDIDGPLLLDLTKEDLKTDFKFKGTEALKLMKFVKEGWRPKT